MSETRKVTNGTRPVCSQSCFFVFLLLTSASVTAPAATTIYTVRAESLPVSFEAISERGRPQRSGKFHLAMGPELRDTLPRSTVMPYAVPSKDSDAAIDPTRDIANG